MLAWCLSATCRTRRDTGIDESNTKRWLMDSFRMYLDRILPSAVRPATAIPRCRSISCTLRW